MKTTRAPQMAPQGDQSPHITRDCGSCTSCCTTMFVRDLNKPAGVPCKYLTPGGCGVYEHRWDVCKGFVCLWHGDKKGLFTEEHRPDKLGLILTPDKNAPADQPRFIAHEVWPRAAVGEEPGRVIAYLHQFGPVRIIPFANPKDKTHHITLTVNGQIIEPAA